MCVCLCVYVCVFVCVFVCVCVCVCECEREREREREGVKVWMYNGRYIIITGIVKERIITDNLSQATYQR